MQMLWPFDPGEGNGPGLDTFGLGVDLSWPRPQPSDAFRPAFLRPPEHDQSGEEPASRSVDRQLAPVEGTPSPTEFAKHFRTLLGGRHASEQRLLPTEYAAQYGRETIARRRHGNPDPNVRFSRRGQRTKLLVNFVQYGIDLFGTLATPVGVAGETLGGHGQGRKWPIVFAGIMFGR